MKYPDQLKTEEWSEKRTSIFKRDNFMCLCCGSKRKLECHHKGYNRNGFIWEVPDDWLETLCSTYHEERTAIEREMRMIPTSEFFKWWETANVDIESLQERIMMREQEKTNVISKELHESRKRIDLIELEEAIARANNPYCIEAFL